MCSALYTVKLKFGGDIFFGGGGGGVVPYYIPEGGYVPYFFLMGDFIQGPILHFIYLNKLIGQK